jgi:hypothetical protein
MAIDAHSEGISLSPQAALNTYTLTAVDFYGSPLVYINITAPETISGLWRFAASLDGSEWPKEVPSNWGITVTGATELSAPVSLIETGLESLRNFYKTVQAMGGPRQFKRVVAALSTVFLLEDKNGTLWDPTTQAPIHPELLQKAREQYDQILAELSNNAAAAFRQASLDWERSGVDLKVVDAATRQDGSLDLEAYLSLMHLKPKATYPYGGSFRNPEAGQRTLIGFSGHGQRPEFFARDSSYRWNIWMCDGFGGTTRTTAIGCGPASFGAMLMYHYRYRGAAINGVTYNSSTPTYSINRILNHISHPVASSGNEPLINYHMGT